jgi:hypothetical protein
MNRWTPCRHLAVAAISVAISAGAAVAAAPAPASPQAAPAAAPADAAYEQAIGKRADDVLKDLALTDEVKAGKVRGVVLDQYRALKAWHDAHDAEVKSLRAGGGDAQPRLAEVRASLKTLHDAFLARLGEELTPEQVERVKDRMTYNVVRVTYDAFRDMLPTLKEEEKAYILATLKEAREEAMDAGSSEEKHAVFGRYKGRINNYLSQRGYDLKKATREWAERTKAAKEKH